MADAVDIVAAGAVLWRPGQFGASEVALVHRPRYDDWSLPKGKVHSGETLTATAVREIREETGYAATLNLRLGESHYRVPQGDKVVHYWAARAQSGQFVVNDEVDELRWVPASAAAEQLTYPRDAEVLERFLRVDPPPEPLLLVRHAVAGRRQEWTGDDDLRPLSEKGHAQANALTELLSRFGPTRLYSATPLRCRQTIEPLAEKLDLPITTEPLFSEAGYESKATLDRLLALAAEPGVAVVCSQGGVIPDLISRLTGQPDPSARKGSTWALSIRPGSSGRLVAADYYPAA